MEQVEQSTLLKDKKVSQWSGPGINLNLSTQKTDVAIYKRLYTKC